MDGVNRRRGQHQRSRVKFRVSSKHLLVGGTVFVTIIVVMMIRSTSNLFVAKSTSLSNWEGRQSSSLGSVSVNRSGKITSSGSVDINKETAFYYGDQGNTTTFSPAGGNISLVECTVSTPPGVSEHQQQHGADSSSASGANGILRITVRHDLSPIASKVFVDLVNAHHFDGVFIFRVLKGFVAQFGVRTAGEDAVVDHQLLQTKPPNTKDEVREQTLSNVRGTLSFAGGNPATRQVFINLGDNQRLDKENSRPFATVDDWGMRLIMDQLYTGYKDGQGQIKTLKIGVAAMREAFPRMSRVEGCLVVSAFSFIVS